MSVSTKEMSRLCGGGDGGGVGSGSDGLGEREDATTDDGMGWSNEGRKKI